MFHALQSCAFLQPLPRGRNLVPSRTTWFWDLILLVLWTDVVSNLLNWCENSPGSLCLGPCAQTNLALQGWRVCMGKRTNMDVSLCVCTLQCCLPGWILWCRHLCKYSLTCMLSCYLPESFILQVCCEFLHAMWSDFFFRQFSGRGWIYAPILMGGSLLLFEGNWLLQINFRINVIPHQG